MKGNRRWGVRFSLAVIAALALLVFTSPWVNQFLFRRMFRQIEADSRIPVKSIILLGPKAVSILLQNIRVEDSILRNGYRNSWGHLPVRLQPWLPSPAREEPGVVDETAQALSCLGPTALPRLLPELNDPDFKVRLSVLESIGLMGPSADETVVAVNRLLHDPHALVRAEAITTLERLGSKKRAAILEMVQLLKDPDISVRGRAASFIGRMGRGTKEEVVELNKMLSEPPSYAREQAIVALWRLTGDTNMVKQLVEEFERPADPETYHRILQVFSEMGPAAQSAAPAILAALYEVDTTVREHAMEVLEGMGANAEAIVPNLRAMLNDGTPYHRRQAALLLWSITGDTKVVPILVLELTQSPEVQTCRRLLSILEEIGPSKEFVVPAITRMLHHPFANQQCLIQFNPTNDCAAIIFDLQDAAAETLGRMGPPARSAARDLEEMLRDPASWRRIDAALALWRIARDPHAPFGLKSELNRARTSRRPEQRAMECRILRALGEMGEAAQSATSSIVDLIRDLELTDENRTISLELLDTARETLGKISVHSETGRPREP